MIDKLQIKNFQCHELMRIKFDPKITAIIGPSDVGKSAILRALRWVATNRPRGDGFVRNGTKESDATVWTDKGKVKRSRGKENTYEVNGRTLKAFGTEVPDAVVDIINIDDDNFSSQHDMPFWFNLTPGEVAKELNKIINLELIDRVLDKIASKVRKQKALGSLLEERVQKTEEELVGLIHADVVDDELRTIEELDTKCFESEEKLNSVNNLMVAFYQSRTKHGVTKEKLKDLSDIVVISKATEETESKIESVSKLLSVYDSSQSTAEVEVPDASELKGIVKQLADTMMDYGWYTSMMDKYQKAKSLIGVYTVQLEELEGKRIEVMKDRCPLCNSKLSTNSEAKMEHGCE